MISRTAVAGTRRLVLAVVIAGCARPGAEPASSQNASATTPVASAPAPSAAASGTSAAIVEADLRARIAIFADDSMMGRNAPQEGDGKGAEYLASELRRMGLEPAGEDGTYFQTVPSIERAMDRNATLAIGDHALRYGVDFVPASRSTPRSIDGVPVVYGGLLNDESTMISRQQAAGRFVVLMVPDSGEGRTRPVRYVPRLASAAGIAIVNLDLMNDRERATLDAPEAMFTANGGGVPLEGPVVVHVTRAAADRLLGASVAARAPGAAGGTVRGNFRLVTRPATTTSARNVVAILRGSDPRLRGQYVAIGAHKDHVGFNAAPLDHDSLRAMLLAQHRAQLSRRPSPPMRVNVDSLRRIRPARLDSIANGADDDGSGSMALLEIAEAMVAAERKPRRSVLFVWHTGEEDGLLGSRHFTDNPTVPSDSIVAQINVDMIGRGTAEDVKGGGPDYLIVVGHRRLSRELGHVVDSVNARQRPPLRFDLSWDAPDHPEGIYDRSDHANYARIGIPVAFFFTGLHADYHQVTDEPQYLDYPHYTRITRYLHDVVRAIADRDGRVRLDGGRPRSAR